VRDNCSAITRLIRDAGGKGTDVSVSVLNKDLLVKYRAAKLKELGDNGSTRRTIASTVRQVRSMLAPKVVQEFSVKLPDLTEFRTFSLGKVPRKDVPLPRYELRRKTAVAARELWINRDPLYLVYALGIYLGMRSDEIAFCRWAWIEDNMGQKRMAICDRESEGFHIKGVRPGNVPVHPVVLRRLQAYKGKSEWMDKLGWSVLDTTKRAHELRRLFGSKVWVKHGQQECFLRMRHTQYSTTEKNYLNYNLSFKPWELMGI
jgi:integrase